jgi:hypothetical protein
MGIKLEIEVTTEGECSTADFLELADLDLASVGGGMGDVAF